MGCNALSLSDGFYTFIAEPFLIGKNFSLEY